ncbi:acyl-homoserine-lactone synthase [Nitrospira lenta]|uniref:N-acyl-L-homoserine lactone synthase n=1 Tax=Nitrospira lenta TaxID=1436998 RepID=A0A330LA09_9BACT|nr:acyl-homoserine-lactone synthase [Nitrospira lenta]SPP63776.1 N-acyl-L-homoserine lactone synthase [Nitrospira lenta]
MQVLEEVRAIEFSDGGLLVKTLTSDEELRESYRLRHRVFAERLKWVPESSDRLEVDSYDPYSSTVGLFDEEQCLRGVFRMVSAAHPFMLEHEFRPCLLPGCEIRKEADTVEITRLALDPSLMDKGLSIRYMQVLYKGVYQWCLQNEARFLYMVVEKRFLRVLRGMGFTCDPISPAVSLPPAEALSIAAVLDWNRFEETCPQKQPEFFRWINMAMGQTTFEKSSFLALDPKVRVSRDGMQERQPIRLEANRKLVAA